METLDELDDVTISRAIIEHYARDLIDALDTEVAIAGGGPAGLMAGYCLARKGIKTTLFERKLSVGGGMWGGGMMFSRIVVQDTGRDVLSDLGIRTEHYRDKYWVADAIECVSTLTSGAVQAGLRIFNLVSVEDVMIRRDEKVSGLVINWSPVEMASLHVDPLTIRAKVVIDATGHACEVVGIVANKVGGRLNTESGSIMGERSMWAEEGERAILGNTREVYPGLYVAGMAANAVYGSPRMGAIFGGMLISGKKAAEMIIEEITANE